MDHGGIILLESDEEMDEDDILEIADASGKGKRRASGKELGSGDSDVVVVSDEGSSWDGREELILEDNDEDDEIERNGRNEHNGVDEDDYRDEYGEGASINTPIRMMNELRTHDKDEEMVRGDRSAYNNQRRSSNDQYVAGNDSRRSMQIDISSGTTVRDQPGKHNTSNNSVSSSIRVGESSEERRRRKEEKRELERLREKELERIRRTREIDRERERERKQQKRLLQQQQQVQQLQQQTGRPHVLVKTPSYRFTSSSSAPVPSSTALINGRQNLQQTKLSSMLPDDDDLMILPNQVAFKRIGMVPEKPILQRVKMPEVAINKSQAFARRSRKNEVPRPLISHDLPGRFSTEIQDYVNGILKDPKASREIKEQVQDPSFFELWINDERQKEEPDAPTIDVLPSTRRKGGKRPPPGNGRKVKGPDFEFIYTPTMIYHPTIALPTPNLGCGCNGACSPFNENCECLQRQKLVSNQGILSFAYNSKGYWRDEFLNDAIWECNSTCGCSPDCPNRVVGNGRTAKLDLIRTSNKGWGVFAREDIAEGQYIVLYSGEVMLSDDAEKRGHLYKERTYLFDLDNMSIFDHVKLVKRLEREMSRPAEERNFQPSCDAERRATLALCDSAREAVEDMEQNGGIDETATSLDAKYSIDAFHYGNLGRYINHACQPNAFLVPVYIDETNALRPLLAIFAYRPIRIYEEITISYSGWTAPDEEASKDPEKIQSQPTKSAARVKNDGPIKDECRCGGPQCRGYMFVQR